MYLNDFESNIANRFVETNEMDRIVKECGENLIISIGEAKEIINKLVRYVKSSSGTIKIMDQQLNKANALIEEKNATIEELEE